MTSTTETRRTLTDLRRDDAGLSSLKGAFVALALGLVMGGLTLAQRGSHAADRPETGCAVQAGCPTPIHARVAP